MATHPESLLDALRNGTLIPFVGAGVSVGAVRHLPEPYRFPDWKGLIEALAAKLSPAAAAETRALLATDSLAAAEKAMTSLGREPFLKEIEALFDRRCPRDADLSLVNAIWRLRPPFVVTTNYDGVLGWPFPEGTVRQIHDDEPSYVNDLASPARQRQVWHLHGSARRRDTIILTASQYTKLYPSATDPKRIDYQNAAERFTDLLKTHSFLFIGYSLDEPLLRERLLQVQDVAAQATQPKFLLLRAGEASDAKKDELLNKFGVHVLEFPNFGEPLVSAVHTMAREAWPGELRLTGPGFTPVMAPLVRAFDEATAGVALPTVDVARLFNAVRPAGWDAAVPGSDRVQQLAAAVQELGTMGVSTSGIHPLLAFADRLKDELWHPYKERTSDWLDRAIEALAEEPSQVALIRTELARQRALLTPQAAHILVRIAPTSGGGGTLRAHAWAFTHGDAEPLLGVEGMAFTMGDEGELVSLLIEAMETRDFDPAITTIAFVVPNEMAGAPMDQWLLPREIADDPPLGATHIVTVRSLDRLRKHRIMRNRLQNAWLALTQRAGEALRIVLPGKDPPAGAVSVRWVDLATACGGSLRKALEEQSIGCVLLKEVPSPNDLAYLRAVLDTTVPIVLWHRDPAAPFAQVEKAVQDMVEAGALADLPQRVRETRALALDPAAPPLGRHLTLLWDNTDYAPPDTDADAKAGILTT